MNRITRFAIAGAAVAGLTTAGVSAADAASTRANFDMVRSKGAVTAGCLPKASATVKIRSVGPVEIITIKAHDLPARTEFDLFVTQIPDAPFGLSWYQGDLRTNGEGEATGTFIGRFSKETFSVAPASVPAPVVHSDGTFPDAATNPATAPVHQFHLGLWFNSPDDAAAAGCPNTVTPFNGEHNAGIQILNTRTFPDNRGPLAQLG